MGVFSFRGKASPSISDLGYLQVFCLGDKKTKEIQLVCRARAQGEGGVFATVINGAYEIKLMPHLDRMTVFTPSGPQYQPMPAILFTGPWPDSIDPADYNSLIQYAGQRLSKRPTLADFFASATYPLSRQIERLRAAIRAFLAVYKAPPDPYKPLPTYSRYRGMIEPSEDDIPF